MNTKHHPTFAMKPVKSSQIEAVGYDAATRTLAIQFKGGAVYHYDDVPKDIHDGFEKAESVGKYFGEKIRRSHFKYRKIGG